MVDMDDEFFEMLFHVRFLDDWVLAGAKSAVRLAMHLIEELGPHLGYSSTLLNVSFSVVTI